jgi:hypothetical protein
VGVKVKEQELDDEQVGVIPEWAKLGAVWYVLFSFLQL